MKFHKNVCMLKNETSTKNMGWTAQTLTKFFAQSILQSLKSILSTQLPDESFHGPISYIDATTPGASMDEIQNALVSQTKQKHTQIDGKKIIFFSQEYLYDNVPKTECPEIESTTIKT